MAIQLREFTADDYEAALALWKRCEGIGLSAADSPCAVKAFLKRNPGLNFTAAVDGKIIGTALCGQDGRRGYLYHLAVDPDYRRQGLGKQLASACLAGLKSAGIQKCHIMVFATNQAGLAFWQSFGWKARPEIELLSYDIEPTGDSSPC